MKMELKKISDISNIVSGSTPRTSVPQYYEGDILWATPKDLSENSSMYLMDTAKKITRAGFDSCSTTILPKNSILFTSRAPIGLIAIAGKEICTNQGFKSLVPANGIDSEYLYYCLRYFTPAIKNLGRGATFKEVSKEIMANFRIPVPDNIEDQKNIARKLKCIEGALEKRRQALRLLDDFLKSTFLEMFGDPILNSKKWIEKKMIDICEKITDGTHHSPREVEKGVPYITAKNIKVGAFDFTNITLVSVKDHSEIYKRCDPVKGDVLYIKDGVTTGIAKFNDLEYPFSMLSSLALLRPQKQVLNSRFLEHYLNFPSVFKRSIQQMKGGAIKRLTIAKIKELRIFMPPLSLQSEFSNIVEYVEYMKLKMKMSEIELQNLFNVLMQNAFKGECCDVA